MAVIKQYENVPISGMMSRMMFLPDHKNYDENTIIQESVIDSNFNSSEKLYVSGNQITQEEFNNEQETNPEPSEEEILENKVNEKLAEMSLDEKIYQLFVITPEMLTGASQVMAVGDTTKSSLEKTPVGGLIYLASNFEMIEQTKKCFLIHRNSHMK